MNQSGQEHGKSKHQCACLMDLRSFSGKKPRQPEINGDSPDELWDCFGKSHKKKRREQRQHGKKVEKIGFNHLIKKGSVEMIVFCQVPERDQDSHEVHKYEFISPLCEIISVMEPADLRKVVERSQDRVRKKECFKWKEECE